MPQFHTHYSLSLAKLGFKKEGSRRRHHFFSVVVDKSHMLYKYVLRIIFILFLSFIVMTSM